MADTPTDRSGAIATGGLAQTLMPARNGRRGIYFQNLSAGDLYINLLSTAAAAQGSIKVSAGNYYESPAHEATPGAISVFGATSGQAFTCYEF